MKDNNDQIAENMRYYGDMRFKQLTLLLAWFTVVGAMIFLKNEKTKELDFSIDIVLANASLLICAVLWIMEVRSTIYWVANREIASELWPRPKSSKMKFINATNAVLIFYISTYSFWTWFIFRLDSICVFRIIAITVGALLLVFTISNYLHIWRHDFKKQS